MGEQADQAVLRIAGERADRIALGLAEQWLVGSGEGDRRE
jgi:hypothetical protein